MIYFGRLDDDLIKFGMTMNLKRRLAEHRARIGRPLTIFATMAGDSSIERLLKIYLYGATDGPAVNGYGHEWYPPHPVLLAFIDDFATPWDGEMIVEAKRRCYRRSGQLVYNMPRRDKNKVLNRMKYWFRAKRIEADGMATPT